MVIINIFLLISLSTFGRWWCCCCCCVSPTRVYIQSHTKRNPFNLLSGACPACRLLLLRWRCAIAFLRKNFLVCVCAVAGLHAPTKRAETCVWYSSTVILLCARLASFTFFFFLEVATRCELWTGARQVEKTPTETRPIISSPLFSSSSIWKNKIKKQGNK